MTLDDKLKEWKQATDNLSPSTQISSTLNSMVREAIANPANAVAKGASLVFPVKVILVVVAVGAAVAGFLGNNSFFQGSFHATRAPGHIVEAPVQPGVGVPVPGRSTVCPEQYPVLGVPEPVYQNEQSVLKTEMRAQLKTRPLTCDAQKHALTYLLNNESLSSSERQHLVVRMTVLCGPRDVARHWINFDSVFEPCDHSQWCHAPKCELSEDSCAREWAKFDAKTCIAQRGKESLLNNACFRFLISQESDAEVRAISPNAWCLKPDALDEAKRLHSKLKIMERKE